jgi:hypothetical protein
MTFVELLGVAAELVGQFAPRVVGGLLLQQLIVMLQGLPSGSGINCSGHSRICRKCP